MTQELDAKGLEAARAAVGAILPKAWLWGAIETAITAYLRATPTKTDIGGLVERLRNEAVCFDTDGGADPEVDAGTARLLRAAADALSASEARIAELERDIDTLEYLHSERDRGEKIVDEKLAAAEARIAALAKALEPFAAWVQHMLENEPRSVSGFSGWSDDYQPIQTVTLGHFRAARKTLEGGK